jgi:hypothetical protein
MYESNISRQNLDSDVVLARAVTMVRLVLLDCATLKRPRLRKTFRLQLLPSNPLLFCQLNRIC